MAPRVFCKSCHARTASIGPDGRCSCCRLALWATLQGLRYGDLMAQLHAQGVDIETLEIPGLPPVRDSRRHRR